jgi:hypothetical protein
MFSQAGSASDGVAWISSLLTAFYGSVSYYDERTLSRKGTEGSICRWTLVIVYYSPVWTVKEGKYLPIWCFLRGTCVCNQVTLVLDRMK